MNWEIFAQIGVLVIAYIGGLVTICHYMGNALANTLGSRIDSLENNLNKRIDDLKNQIIRDHDNLSKKVDKTNDLLIAHITDHKLHNI